MKNKNKINKYPIFYQGEKYEVRIKIYQDEDAWGGTYEERVINIYKVKEYKLFFYKIFRRKKIFATNIDKVPIIKKGIIKYNNGIIKREIIGVEPDQNSDNYYVELFKNAFQLYIDKLNKEAQEQKKENRKLAALENWNGVIK